MQISEIMSLIHLRNDRPIGPAGWYLHRLQLTFFFFLLHNFNYFPPNLILSPWCKQIPNSFYTLTQGGANLRLCPSIAHGRSLVSSLHSTAFTFPHDLTWLNCHCVSGLYLQQKQAKQTTALPASSPFACVFTRFDDLQWPF